MAKSAKVVEVDVTSKVTKQFTGNVLERLAEIESERGKFMRYARGKKEAITALHETLASTHGVPQKSSKVHVKILRSLERIKGWLSDLENDDRAMALKLAKAQGDPQQLSLWDSLPADKPAKKKRAKVPKQKDMEEAWAKAEPAGQA